MVNDFRDHFADRLISGLGMMLVLLPLTMFAMFALYVPMIGGMLIGAALDDEVITLIGGAIGMLAGVLLMVVLVTVPIMPLYGSLGRAVLRNLDDGSDLGFAAPFETATQDIGKILGTSALTTLLVFGGLMLCYLPGMLVGFLVGFALPGVIVHRLSPVDAIRRSVEHVIAEPLWHLGFYFVSMGISLVFSYIPFIGMALLYPFLLSFQIRAYVRIFGRD